MALLINQGKQNMENNNDFAPIVCDDVTAQITKVALDEKWDNTLNLTFKVISEKYKGRLFWDRVSFDPKSQYAWKYLALRRAVGKPYSPNEGTQIDIEALLLNKAVNVNLSTRVGSDGKEYQAVKYKDAKVMSTFTPQAQAPSEDDAPLDLNELNDLPFYGPSENNTTQW